MVLNKFMYIKYLKSTVVDSVCDTETGLYPKASGKLKDDCNHIFKSRQMMKLIFIGRSTHDVQHFLKLEDDTK